MNSKKNRKSVNLKHTSILVGAIYFSFTAFTSLLLLQSPAFANQAKLVDVRVSSSQGSYRFDVTLRHADTGWDHYADSWEVISANGEVLAKRVLAHPHVGEQPFTRSLSGVKIPDGTKSVSIRAHDSVHGYNKEMFEIKLR